ncbi:MAG: hypothetical protein WD042_10520 [Phycisphaeraceae bacterium]
MTDALFDVKRAHRWFAVELNNLAWEHVEALSRRRRCATRTSAWR